MFGAEADISGRDLICAVASGEVNMQKQFERTELIFGSENMEKLSHARVAVFGVGGVGGYTVEALARSGVGTLDLIDRDTVSESNINRQILATHQTIGRCKVEVARERILSINPQATVHTYPVFFMPDTAEQFDFGIYDYVVDAIDTVTGKIELVMRAQEAGVPIICSMGAGNKLEPTAFEVADLYQTSVCPLAKVMRRELKKRGVKKLKVVYSKEKPVKLVSEMTEENRRQVPGSNAFVPSVAGLIIAGEVIKDIIQVKAQIEG